MPHKNVWIIKQNKSWIIKKENEDEPISRYFIFSTQKAAIFVGKMVAKILNSELIIQDEDGKIRQKDSYGNDPYPPKG